MSADHQQTKELEVEIDGECHRFRPSETQHLESISDLLRRAGFPLNTRCGGRGVCDGCRIELLAGEVVDRQTRQTLLHEGTQSQSIRACEQSASGTGARLRVPPRSSMKHQPQIVSDYQICVPAAHDPLFQQIVLPADSGRVGLAKTVQLLRPGLPVRLDSTVTEPVTDTVVAIEQRPDHRLITSCTTAKVPALGAAVDIGTTTVAVMLIDLSDGKVLARASQFNEQIHFGEDVVTRINLCMVNAEMVGQLQRAIAQQTILPLLQQTTAAGGRSLGDIRCITLAGNTTMLHLIAGIDPTPMGVSPFTPVFLNHTVATAGSVFGNCGLQADTSCHLLPSAAAYIGADLTAGIVATGLLYEPRPCLLIDIGTNGEIILKHGDRLIGCATAAGPAFEGSRLSCGMRAVEGAISHIDLTPTDVTYTTIGDGAPVGMCGSAYVDFLAKAYSAGLLNHIGRFNTAIGGPLGDRLMPGRDGRDIVFRVAQGPGRQPIVVSQCDIAVLLQAKAAIAAGTHTLLDRFGLKASDIETVFLAGGFGTHLDRSCAINSGLLRGFTTGQVRPVGNTSLAGAYLSLMDAGLLTEMIRAAKNVEIVELNLDPMFESRFIDELSLS